MSFDFNYSEPVRLSPEDQDLVDFVHNVVRQEEEQAFAAALAQREFEENQVAAELLRAEAEAGVIQQVGALERQLGRGLAPSEIQAIGEQIAEYTNAGRDPDIYDAVGQLASEGKPLLDIDKRSDRVQIMTQQAQENERAQASRVDLGTHLASTPEPSLEAYDLGRHEDRVAFAMDKLAGADVEGRTYEAGDAA